ncbi:MAG: hypothetical protein ACRDTH_12640 [Pseudonocardiaceae bacterium]
MDYRTQDGLADYGFAIEYQPDGGWRVYIIFLPLHQDHDDSLQLPYQAVDRYGRRYVNWSSRLDSLGEARTVAALWAELIQSYQRSQERNGARPAGPDRPGGAATAGGSGPGHREPGAGTSPPAMEAA